jgi:HK97 family phage major capsid protein
VIHPTDWQSLKLAKDANNQYYGGGPFTGPYGVGGIVGDTFWGLRVVVTTAIAQGTCLVGAFKLGAQIWQREGVKVEAFDQNEDDVNFNRVTVRVEERLGLAVYRPSAFCTVTSLN